MNQGLKKTLIPAYFDMDPYHMPGELRNLQAMNAADFTFHEDITEIIRKKLADVKEEKPAPETKGQSLRDKYAPQKKVQILVDKLDCEREHAEEVLVVCQGNIEDSEEYIKKEEDYKKVLWICAECGSNNTHDVCHNSECNLSKADSISLRLRREEARRNSERERQRKADLKRSLGDIDADYSLSVEDRIACTKILLKKKSNIIWPTLLLASLVVFAISVFLGITVLSQATYPEIIKDIVSSALKVLGVKSKDDLDIIYILVYISGAVVLIMSGVYYSLASKTGGVSIGKIAAQALVDVVLFFLALIIINGPITVILTIISNILMSIFGGIIEDVIKEGTVIASFVIVVSLNYIVSVVNLIRLRKLKKALKTKLALLKEGRY
jgi:hypothetical protein